MMGRAGPTVRELRGSPDGRGRRVAIVISRFNENVTGRLLAGATACLTEHGVPEDAIDVISVPGAWELPHAARLAADTQAYAAIIALGCVIRGETPHFDFVAGPAAEGLAVVSLETRLPVALGLLTTEDMEQALARAGGRHGNKGWDAAEAALEMADLTARIRESNAST
jgi:6,7-dimethyl-8-ribityllumazine synthase